MFYPHYNHQLIKSLLTRAESLGLSRSARLRLTWFVFAMEHEWNVSKTCRHFGIARSTFIRWMDRFDPRNPQSLEEHDRRPHRIREAQEDPTVVAFIEKCRREDPYISKELISQHLTTQLNISVSASTVGRIIQRHSFFFGATRAHCIKRVGFDDSLSSEELTTPSPISQIGKEGEDDIPSFDALSFLGT